ncbi:MotA/TolQ/ExbB proton channel family protein [Botrimarina hoheduenensis]|uniref:Biopolymer transport protein ExbB n=1 Tax=Botrimarina hoheduenensis TaxID=2528000 RepID=A0A5C5VX19_9BACT|nr:MotA/TolQ/ExbB proton channel family protein [Botrimarina hoheduenensis]TWT43206.1 Biopolymer transport protein ExbB [Botrimarina hoheduenensis]
MQSMRNAAAWGEARKRLVLMVVLVVGGCCLYAAPARAQDADPAEVAAPASADLSADASADGQRRSYLSWAWDSLGPGYSVIFLGLSFLLLSLMVMNLVKASRANVAPPDLIEAFEAHLNAKQYSEAYDLAASDDSFLGRVLAAGLGRLSGGGDYPRAIEMMQEVGEEESMKLEHRLSYMALIGTISPMIGLLGTVQGMIASFTVIATSPTTPKPSELAEGISTALFTTLIGLALAIPAIAAYNLLRNRVQRLVLDVGIVSEGLLSRFEKRPS